MGRFTSPKTTTMMIYRYFLFFTLLAAVLQPLTAQNRNVFLGGNLGFSYSSTDSDSFESERLTVSISPYVGYWMSSQLAIGGGIRYGYTSGNASPPNFAGTSRSNSIGANVWGRYFLNADSKFQVYCQPAIGYNFSVGDRFPSSLQLTEVRVKSNNVSLSALFGATYSLSDRLLLNLRVGSFALSRGWETNDNPSISTRSYFDAGFNFQPRSVGFGIEYFL